VVGRASCCCGQLTALCDGEPSLNAICHCDSCKRRPGSAFGWSCYFREAEVSVQGEARAHAVDSAGGRQERSFCPVCGTTLSWRSAALSGMIGIAGGSLAESTIGEPPLSASENGRCAWLHLPDAWLRSP
jgi:hypothetical protein